MQKREGPLSSPVSPLLPVSSTLLVPPVFVSQENDDATPFCLPTVPSPPCAPVSSSSSPSSPAEFPQLVAEIASYITIIFSPVVFLRRCHAAPYISTFHIPYSLRARLHTMKYTVCQFCRCASTFERYFHKLPLILFKRVFKRAFKHATLRSLRGILLRTLFAVHVSRIKSYNCRSTMASPRHKVPVD